MKRTIKLSLLLAGLSLVGCGDNDGDNAAFKLPPDPGAAGLTTTAGIDSNNNSLRDDVEIAISKMGVGINTQKVLRAGAQALQKATIASTEAESDAASEAMAKFAYCLGQKSGANAAKQLAILQSVQMNTPDRVAAYNTYNKTREGTNHRVETATPAECQALMAQ